MAFREFRSYQLFKANEIAGSVPVWGGSEPSVAVTPLKRVAVTMQVDSRAGLKVALRYNAPVKAPIAAGQQVGTLAISAPDFPTLSVPVYAVQDVPRAGLWSRMITGIKSLFGKGS